MTGLADEEGAVVAPPSRRRWFTTVAVVAILVLVAAELGLRAFESRLPEPILFHDAVPQLKLYQLQRLSEAGGVDVLVAGSSTAMFDVDPNQLHDLLAAAGAPSSTYNAGVTAGLPGITADWLERFAVPLATPRVVVWVLSTGDLNDGVRIPAVAAYRSSIAVRTGFWAELTRKVEAHVAIVAYRSVLRDPDSWLDIAAGRPDELHRAAARLDERGGSTVFDLPLNDAARRQAADIVSDFRLDGGNEGLIRDEVQRLEDAGIQVVLAEAGVPERTVALHPDGFADVATGRDLLASIAAGTGADFVALPDALRDDALYQDFTHLNQDGARAFTANLAPAVAAAVSAATP